MIERNEREETPAVNATEVLIFEKSKLTGGLTQGESRPTELEKIKEEENSLPVNAEKCENEGMGEEFMRDEDDLMLLEEMDRMLKSEKARQKTSECNKL